MNAEEGLTAAELLTLTAAARGLDRHRTAQELHVSEATVRYRLRSARRKLQALTTAEAVALCRRADLV